MFNIKAREVRQKQDYPKLVEENKTANEMANQRGPNIILHQSTNPIWVVDIKVGPKRISPPKSSFSGKWLKLDPEREKVVLKNQRELEQKRIIFLHQKLLEFQMQLFLLLHVCKYYTRFVTYIVLKLKCVIDVNFLLRFVFLTLCATAGSSHLKFKFYLLGLLLL